MFQAKHSIYEGHLWLKPQEFRTVILFRYVIDLNQQIAKLHFKNCNNKLENCKCDTLN